MSYLDMADVCIEKESMKTWRSGIQSLPGTPQTGCQSRMTRSRSFQLTMPTRAPFSSTGRQETCCSSMMAAASGKDESGEMVMGWRLMI